MRTKTNKTDKFKGREITSSDYNNTYNHTVYKLNKQNTNTKYIDKKLSLKHIPCFFSWLILILTKFMALLVFPVKFVFPFLTILLKLKLKLKLKLNWQLLIFSGTQVRKVKMQNLKN